MSLKLVNLSKRYENHWVLRDVSFDVEPGEIFGIFGPSGAGKTSLLSLVLGRAQPSGGGIFFDEQNMTKLSREGRNFATPRPADGSIWRRLVRKGSGLSRGKRRAHVFDEAIHNASTVLLLDDPFSGMEIRDRERRVATLRDVANEKKLSVIFASSDFNEVLDVCDRVAVLVNGEIQQIDQPQEIYERPMSRIIAEITGRNNLFAARRLTSSKAETPEFHTIDGGHRLFAQRMERGALGALNQNVSLAIRPEQISISFGASFPEDNLLKAKIAGVRFLGPTTLIQLDADGLKLEALVLRLVGLNIGDECMVGLPPDRIQILKD